MHHFPQDTLYDTSHLTYTSSITILSHFLEWENSTKMIRTPKLVLVYAEDIFCVYRLKINANLNDASLKVLSGLRFG